MVRRHPRLIAPLLGLASATGFAPLGWWPVALAALAGLFALIAAARRWHQAALIGWLFGVGHFCMGNNWIATAFTYQAAMPAWLGWIAVGLLSLYLAVFPAFAALLAWLAARGRVAALVPALPGAWIIGEWLRSWVATGFAWNPIAAIALGPFDRPGLAQVLPVTGTYALSGVVLLLAGGWYLAARAMAASDWRRAALAAAPAALMLLPTVAAPEAGRTRFTLVQPAIPQSELNDPARFADNFERLARFSPPLPGGNERLLLWPESGVPDYLREGYPDRYYIDTFGADARLARQRLGRVAGVGGLLLSGTADLEIAGGRAVGARNSVTAIDPAGQIRGWYAKAHLVPYGEYLPMRALLTPLGLSRLVPGAIDFWPGPGPRTMDLGAKGRAGIQICYEIIFSGQVTDRADRPDFIFNPSNDGWFGAFGPPQHLAQARLRAIEEGLPVLRATTTGISAVIDPRGVVLAHLPHNEAGRLDGTIPRAAADTPFSRLGNMLPLGWALLFLAASLVASLPRRR